MGERTNRSRLRRIRQVITSDPAVERVGELLTMQMGPQETLLTVEIRFLRSLDIQQLESAISRIKSHIRNREPSVQKIFIDPERFPQETRDQTAAA